MDSKDFWNDISTIIDGNFSSEGLYKLESYAEQFISGKLLYQRFSPAEQHGCIAGGPTNVIATLLAGADVATNSKVQEPLNYKEECKRGKTQETIIEPWARKTGYWYEDTDFFSKTVWKKTLQKVAKHLFINMELN